MPRTLLPLLLLLAAPLSAADPAPPAARTTAELDSIAIDVLKEMHNAGADLYNSADAAGALKTYEAALRTISPFLSHRPKVQQTIADGLVAASKLDGPKAQAFKLHEVIDQVRTDLKAAVAAEPKVESKPDPKPTPPPTPMPEPKKVEQPPPAPPAVPRVTVPGWTWRW